MTQGGRRGRIGRKLALAFVAFVMVVVGGTGWALYDVTRRSLEREMSERLVAVARLVAGGLDGGTVRVLRPGDEGFRIYASLTARLRRAQKMVGARRIVVFDQQGRGLLDTAPGAPIGREYARLRIDRAEVASVWRGASAHSALFQGEDGVFYKSGYAPVYDKEEVVAGVGVEIGAGFLETIQRFRSSVVIFGAVSAALTVLIGLGLARTITGPVRRLVDAAHQIGRGDLKQAVEAPSQDELGDLADTMEEMRRRLVARDAQLRQMLAGVAHEIRNPLGGIEIYAGLIADDLPDGDARKAHIRKVIGEVQTLNRIISEFLDFARPTQPHPTPTPVARLAGEAAFLLAPEMEAAGVRYVQEAPEGLEVRADPEQVKRALLNLMKNGVQAMQGGGTLTLRVREGKGERGKGRKGEKASPALPLSHSPSPGWVVVEVADTGPGMPPEVRARAFEPFFTTREKGTGLGLAVVQKIAEENGGAVEVESEAGKGTTFRVVLPGIERRGS